MFLGGELAEAFIAEGGEAYSLYWGRKPDSGLLKSEKCLIELALTQEVPVSRLELLHSFPL